MGRLRTLCSRARGLEHYYRCYERIAFRAGWDVAWTTEDGENPEVGGIWDGTEYVGHVSIYDHGIPWRIADHAARHGARVVISVAPTPGPYAEKILPIVKPGGYFSPLLLEEPGHILIPNTQRGHRLQSRMRTHQDHADRKDRPWSLARKAICDAAQAAGFPTDKIPEAKFREELADSILGMNWRGICALNFRVPEYLAYGVTMFSDPLDFDILPGVRLEPDVEYVPVVEPEEMVSRALSMLRKDPDHVARIGLYGRKFYVEHLSWDALGMAYRRMLQEATK